MSRRLVAFLLLTLLLLVGCVTTAVAPEESGGEPAGDSLASVHFIDVGQGDCILIKTGTKAALIDAGESDKGDEVVAYLRGQQVTALDLVVSTHPHSDHIGGLPLVLQTLPVARVIDSGLPHSSQIYLDYLGLIEQQSIPFELPNAQSIDLGEGVRLEIIGPVKQYQDLNNSSVVARLVAGGTSVLFTGDMERAAEADLLAAAELRSSVLKVGHHGSNTSTSAAFLSEVRPELAVISVGADNSYGHPAKATLSSLAASQVVRTDQAGTVVLEIGPEGYRLLPGQSEGSSGVTVYVTAAGGKYHREGCRYLNDSKTPWRLDDALDAGYTPCGACRPPTK